MVSEREEMATGEAEELACLGVDEDDGCAWVLGSCEGVAVGFGEKDGRA